MSIPSFTDEKLRRNLNNVTALESDKAETLMLRNHLLISKMSCRDIKFNISIPFWLILKNLPNFIIFLINR